MMSDHDYASTASTPSEGSSPEYITAASGSETEVVTSSRPQTSDLLPQDQEQPKEEDLGDNLQGTSAQSQAESKAKVEGPVETADASKAEAKVDKNLPVTAVPGASSNVSGASTNNPVPGSSNSNPHYLSNDQKNERMRTIFQSGLQAQFSSRLVSACKAVGTQLFHHQQVGLSWMINKENTGSGGMRGGILADEMGLGKTLTVISLILTNDQDERPLCKPDYGFIRPTLCIKKGGKGKGKVAPKSAKELGVGSKLGAKAPSKSSSGFFGKFKKQKESSQSESETDEEIIEKFKFGQKRKSLRKRKEKDFPDPTSSCSESEDSFESEDTSETEEDSSHLMSSSPVSKKGARKRNAIDSSEEDEDQSEETAERKKPRATTELEEVPEINPGLNLDGKYDEDSSDEETPSGRKR